MSCGVLMQPPQSGSKLGRFRKWNRPQLYRSGPHPMGSIGASAHRSGKLVRPNLCEIAPARPGPGSHPVRRSNSLVRGFNGRGQHGTS